MGLKWGQIYFPVFEGRFQGTPQKIDLSPFKPHLSPFLQEADIIPGSRLSFLPFGV